MPRQRRHRPLRAGLPVVSIALAVGGCGEPGSRPEGSLTPDQVDGIHALATTPMEEGRAAGMSIAVVRGADTLLIEEFGHADLELGVPTPPDAVYEVGSVTKQFTAAAVLLLQEEGKLSLDDPLTKWLPDYPVGDRTVTVRRLLDHTSGIKGYTELRHLWAEIAPLELPRDTLVTLFSAEPFEFEPGTAMTYNNSAYFLAGLIIEAASGMSYEDFVEERLFGAAGMENSRYCHKDELVPNRARGYEPGDDGLLPAPYLNHIWPYAAGSLCSTARDLMAWNQALHGDGEGGEILSPESYRLMITPEPLLDGTELRYAKGVAITDRDGTKGIRHGGGIFGFVTDLRYYPAEDLSIAVLINTAGGVASSDIAQQVEDVILGQRAEVMPIPFDGDAAPYAGRYEGPARGQRLVAEVGIEDGQLTIDAGPGSAGALTWLGGDTFGRGSTRFRFVRNADGVVDELRMDVTSGHYVLRRVEP
ncbi:serine hydrolase domain-containing protein [Candidatus Palauibacter sp.]|uniref:serine hydrolase domain-containing protein n=1 Tax=Candidatus Palauibacter sp. TaxID=3101350 RepID=UPI003B02594C